MRFALILIAVALLSPIGFSADIFVPDDYPTIQGAINAAVDGDTVIVRPGTYVENIDFVGKAITVKSEHGPGVTTIDGNQKGSVVWFSSGEGVDSVLDGFALTKGSGADLWPPRTFGGGICCEKASPTIKNNTISGNSASIGGGIYCEYASPTVTRNIIAGNNAWKVGGGIGFYDSSPVITGNIISGNDTTVNGGAIYCDNSSSTLTNNTVAWNTADHGGGIHCFNSSPTITNNTVFGNKGASYSGGLCCFGSQPTICNTILWDNDAPTGPEIWIGSTALPSTLSISYSDVDGSQSSVYVETGCTLDWGAGMIDADPLFTDTANDDFHLTWDSPCRDTGDNTVVTELYDFEGDPRIHDGIVDMGADEFHPHLYSIGDVVPGSPISIRVIGPPPAPVTLALGSGVQDPPLSTLYGDLYLQFPILQTIPLAPIPPEGVRILNATVPSFWFPGEEKPLQALVGPLGNPNSVLTNLMTLTVE